MTERRFVDLQGSSETRLEEQNTDLPSGPGFPVISDGKGIQVDIYYDMQKVK